MRAADPKEKKQAAKRQVSGKLFDSVFLPWMAVIILLHLLTMYVAPAYMWGVHFYHFYPPWVGWVLVLLSLTVLIPGVSQFLYLKSENLAKRVKKPFDSSSQNKSFLILSLLSLPVFWIFRSRLHLLGDGYFRIIDLPEGRLHLQEWLDAVIHLVVYRAMVKLIPGWTPELTYAIISVLCGGFFVFLALKLCALLGRTGLGKTLIFFSLISLGSVQLFFGYVESYSILQVVLLAYILLSALYLMRKVSVVPALIAFVVSVGLHVTSLVFAPSLVYLLIKTNKDRSRKKGSPTKTVSNAFIFAGLMVASFLVVSWIFVVATGLEKTGKGIFILPLTATEGYKFGVFSLGHISEFLNQLLLLSPLSMSLIVLFLLAKIRFNEFRDRLTNFLILATSFALVYLFDFNFTLGSADWDLRSMPAPFIGLLGILLFLRWGEKPSAALRLRSGQVHRPPSAARDQSKAEGRLAQDGATLAPPLGKRFRAWGVIFIWFSLFHTVPWIMINAHSQRSLDRYLLIQENDPHPVDETGYNLYKIARILRFAELDQEIPGMYERAIARNAYDTLSYFNLAAHYHQIDLYDQAVPVLDTLLKVDPAYPKANWMMGNIYVKWKEYAKALPYLEEAYPNLADNTDFLYELGASYFQTEEVQKAGEIAVDILELDPYYVDAYHLLGSAYARLGDLKQAKEAWEKVLTLDPTDSIAINNLKELEKYLKE
ncbi:MAG: tetratricopeptide repeat protein [Candidatus Zixiibacteriota bacterium]|nr:MAG: tetratricopeptide repeat protein [candidate division Zixibacteria bacterium]